jgi:hypothetical protein
MSSHDAAAHGRAIRPSSGAAVMLAGVHEHAITTIVTDLTSTRVVRASNHGPRSNQPYGHLTPEA